MKSFFYGRRLHFITYFILVILVGGGGVCGGNSTDNKNGRDSLFIFVPLALFWISQRLPNAQHTVV
jgi:hypothetical protein